MPTGSFDLTNLIVAIIGVLAGVMGAWYARKAIAGPRLVVGGNDDGDVRSGDGLGGLVETVKGDKRRTLDLSHFGMIADLKPQWGDAAMNASPIRLNVFVQNKGWKTAKGVRMYVRQEGLGYTMTVEGGYVPTAVPAESFFLRRLQNIHCKDLGDIAPGIKHPVTLVVQFESRLQAEAAWSGSDPDNPVLFHDYYFSADDTRIQAQAMWLNVSLPAVNVQ